MDLFVPQFFRVRIHVCLVILTLVGKESRVNPSFFGSVKFLASVR